MGADMPGSKSVSSARMPSKRLGIPPETPLSDPRFFVINGLQPVE